MWPLCLVVLAATVFSSVGGILCLGEDGHSQLEIVWHPCCGSVSGETGHAAISNFEMPSDNCGDCSDVSLWQATRYRHASGFSVDFLSNLTQNCLAPCELIDPDSTNVSVKLLADVLFPSRYASVILPITVILC